MENSSLEKCPNCQHHAQRLGRETTLYLYLWQEMVNHIRTICQNCQQSRIVWELDRQQINELFDGRDNNSINIIVEPFASDRTWQLFCRATGRRYPKRPRFTAAEANKVEKEVGFMRYLLEKGLLP